jgi:hypothetical protein
MSPADSAAAAESVQPATRNVDLCHIFPKLGITSRAQLTAMSLDLPVGAPAPEPVSPD